MSTGRVFTPLEAKDIGVDREASERPASVATGYEADQRDALGAYLRQIAAKPLLSAAEEKRLARRARVGSKQARDKLVARNLRLVMPTAKKYRGQGLSLEDLIQEGNAGLMVAADRFDPEMGYRFSTYATRWIHQRISYAVATYGRTIRLPRGLEETRYKAYRAAREYTATEGREPSDAEVCELTGISEEELRRVRSAPEHRASLDVPVRTDEPDAATMGSLMVDDEQGEEIGGDEPQALARLEIRRVLGALKPRQRYVLERLYGLDGGPTLTRRELATEMGLSVGRVGMIDREAREKLEQSLRAHGIASPGLQRAS